MNEEKLARKLVGEKKMEAMVLRLDRLTQDEARLTVAEVLKVVHGLVENMKVVMGGEQILHVRRSLGVEDLSLETARYRLTILRKPSVCFQATIQ
jgi:hypothetical protein